MTDFLRAGLEAFNRRAYWECHEDWEKAWKSAPTAMRPALKGAIQVAAAFLKIEQAKFGPATRLLRSALSEMERGPAPGWIAHDLKREAMLALARLEALGPERVREFPGTWYPQLSWE